jgi:hypothetical protein
MTPKAFAFDPDPEFSDDDPRFARAFAHAHTPVLSIHIHLQEARAPLLQENRSVLDELAASDDRPRVQSMQATVTMTASMPAGFGQYMPGAFGYPMSAGFGCLIHTSEELLFQKPSAAYEEAYREIEEIVDEEEGDDPNKGDSSQALTPVPDSEQNLPNNLTNSTQGLSTFNQSELVPTVVREERGLKTNNENTPVETSKKTKSRRKFPDIVTEEVQRALKGMGLCPQGYAWSRAHIGKFGRHVCEGGCHFAYDGELNGYMDDNGYL